MDWTDKPVVNAAEVTALLRTYEDEAMAFRERKAIPLSLHVYDGLAGKRQDALSGRPRPRPPRVEFKKYVVTRIVFDIISYL